jgi:hypothetical protein
MGSKRRGRTMRRGGGREKKIGKEEENEL